MNILVLGGTQFSGRAFVELAVNEHHSVTLLHRSKQDPGLPKAVRRLVGDRDPLVGDGLDRIKELLDEGAHFDAVVDMCGYTPRVVGESCRLLKDHTDQYLFISTISVYQRSSDGAPDESTAFDQLEQLQDQSVEEITGETYGGLKVLCEQVVNDAFPDSATIIRPGVIAGPNDPTDRITWWTRMLAKLSEMTVPDHDAGLAQFIDARDLAAFMLHCIAQKHFNTFNATGPIPNLSLHHFINRSNEALGASCRLIQRPPSWFTQHDIKPWIDIPTWIDPQSQSMYRVDSSRAIRSGLTPRPLEDTMRDIRAWDVQRGEPELKAGMSLDRARDLSRS